MKLSQFSRILHFYNIFITAKNGVLLETNLMILTKEFAHLGMIFQIFSKFQTNLPQLMNQANPCWPLTSFG